MVGLHGGCSGSLDGWLVIAVVSSFAWWQWQWFGWLDGWLVGSAQCLGWLDCWLDG